MKRKEQVPILAIEEAQARRKAKRREAMSAEKAQKRVQVAHEKKERPKMSVGKKFGVVLVIGVALLLFGMGGYRNIELGLQKADVQRQYDQKLAEKNQLEKQKAASSDPAYIEQEARDRFHMLKDGEILYVYPNNESDNSQ